MAEFNREEFLENRCLELQREVTVLHTVVFQTLAKIEQIKKDLLESLQVKNGKA